MMSSSYGYRESESAWAIVFGPMAVLATIFALTWSTTIANRYLGFSSPSTILSMGALAFGLASVVCAYVGRRHLRRVEHLSRSDSLTRLPNRRALHFDIQRVSLGGPVRPFENIVLDSAPGKYRPVRELFSQAQTLALLTPSASPHWWRAGE